MDAPGNLVDSPTHRCGESIFEHEYLQKFEAKIGTAWKVVYGTEAKAIYAKTSEKLVHCHVPLIRAAAGFDFFGGTSDF